MGISFVVERTEIMFGDFSAEQTRHSLNFAGAGDGAAQSLLIACDDKGSYPEPRYLNNSGNISLVQCAANVVPGDCNQLLEFIQGSKNLRSIIICGHSNCRRIMELISSPGSQPWMAHCAGTASAISGPYHDYAPEQKQLFCVQNNCLEQRQNLLSPAVVGHLLQAGIDVQCWIWDEELNWIYVYDPDIAIFVPSIKHLQSMQEI